MFVSYIQTVKLCNTSSRLFQRLQTSAKVGGHSDKYSSAGESEEKTYFDEYNTVVERCTNYTDYAEKDC